MNMVKIILMYYKQSCEINGRDQLLCFFLLQQILVCDKQCSIKIVEARIQIQHITQLFLKP
jgi:hypothetical protein